MFRLLPFLLLLLATGACNPKTQDTADSDIRALLAQQAKSWNQGDIPGFMAAYENSENLIFTSGSNVRTGFKETLERYQASYGDKGAMGRLDFEVLDIRVMHPSSAVVLGSWKLTETPKSGEGIFTLVLFQGANGWKIIHDHTSIKTVKTE